uniref:Legume lectin domain-containing protein n=1 Tax=Setaria digitata TaxID=48799 RepID=A0A915Q6S9_9BILA
MGDHFYAALINPTHPSAESVLQWISEPNLNSPRDFKFEFSIVLKSDTLKEFPNYDFILDRNLDGTSSQIEAGTRPETTKGDDNSIGRASFAYPVTFITTAILISWCRAATRQRQTKRWCGTTDINCSGVVCECLFGRSVGVGLCVCSYMLVYLAFTPN